MSSEIDAEAHRGRLDDVGRDADVRNGAERVVHHPLDRGRQSLLVSIKLMELKRSWASQQKCCPGRNIVSRGVVSVMRAIHNVSNAFARGSSIAEIGRAHV